MFLRFLGGKPWSGHNSLIWEVVTDGYAEGIKPVYFLPRREGPGYGHRRGR